MAPAESSSPVYRLYNPNAGDHHYTLSSTERDRLVALGWKDEGIGWYSDTEQTVPVYRQYNPNAMTGSHNFTTNENEDQGLRKLGWSREGIDWYAAKEGCGLSERENWFVTLCAMRGSAGDDSFMLPSGGYYNRYLALIKPVCSDNAHAYRSAIQAVLNRYGYQVSDERVQNCLDQSSGEDIYKIGNILNILFKECDDRYDYEPWLVEAHYYPEPDSQARQRYARIKNDLGNNDPVIVLIWNYRLRVKTYSDGVPAVIYQRKDYPLPNGDEGSVYSIFLPYDGGYIFDVSSYDLFRLMRDMGALKNVY